MKHTLASYARNFGRLSETNFLAQIASPVLVERAHADSSEDAAPSFRTKFVDSSDAVSRTLIPDAREVFLVQKNRGSTFSGHIGVGRTSNLDICIPRAGVSKFHAYFSTALDGVQLTDKASTNGTFVNGERLAQGVPTVVTDGADVQFAHYAFMYLSPSRFFALIRSL